MSPLASVTILSLWRAAALELYLAVRLAVSLQSLWLDKNSLAFLLPPTFILFSSVSFHLSMVTDLTKDRCTPNPRCFPEHSKHIQIPKVTLTHCGLWVPHSKHLLLF